MKKKVKFALDIQSKQPMGSTEGGLVVEGYSTTTHVDSQGTRFTEKALKEAAQDFLEYSTVLFNHDPNRPIGRIVEAQFDGLGIWVKVHISNYETEIKQKVMDGTISKFSVMGEVPQESCKEVENKALGKTIMEMDSVKFYETSLVSIPANSEAEAKEWHIEKNLKNNNMDVKKELTKLSAMKKDEMVSFVKGLVEKLKNQGADKDGKKKASVSTSEIISTLEKIMQEAGDQKTVEGLVESLLAKLTTAKNPPEGGNDEEVEENKKELGMAEDSKNIYLVDDSTEGKMENNKFRKQILKIGKWFHRDAKGGVLEVTKEAIKKIIKNFKEGILDHVYVPLGHTNDVTKNKGEVVDLIETEDGIDAIIEVKDESVAEKIKKGIIKAVSSSIIENYVQKSNGKAVGPALAHVALVAEPYIKGMAAFKPVNFSEEEYNFIQLDEEPMTAEKAIDIIEDVLGRLKEASKKPDEDKKEPEDDKEKAKVDAGEEKKDKDDKDTEKEDKEEPEAKNDEKTDDKEDEDEEKEDNGEIKEKKSKKDDNLQKTDKKDEKVELEDKKVEKGAIPFKSYGKDATGAWDAGAETKDATVEDLMKMCAWYNSEDKENKGAYKLPHHKKSGYTTVWKGVAAAMAALLGSRGGVDIPDSDKSGVYNHLAKHYKEFDKEVPELKSYSINELKSMFKKDLELEDQQEDKKKTEAEGDKAKVEEPKEEPGNAGKSDDKSNKEEELEAQLSEKERQIMLSDAEQSYDAFLKQGKIVPAQKSAFISLMTSRGSAVNLSDEDVDIKQTLKTFLENAPKTIDFEEKSLFDAKQEPEEMSSGEKADAIFKGLDLSDEQLKKAHDNVKKFESIGIIEKKAN